MKRFEMIKNKDYFSHIIKNGKYTKDNCFVIYFVSNDNNTYPHFGLALKKSLGKAVVRNNVKRKVRAIIDKNRKLFKNSEDYIIMIRKDCITASFDQLDNSINKLLKGKK